MLHYLHRPLAATLLATVLTAPLALVGLPLAAGEPPLVLLDPADDDNGPGPYKYPTDPAYKPKSFDLRKVEIADKGDDVEFRVTVGASIEDPWNSKDWDGNGFSLQFVQIYVDTDHQKGGGFTKALPGLGAVEFSDDEAWDKVVLISPQGKARLSAELRQKAGAMRGGTVIPKTTKFSGKTLIAIVAKKDLGQPNGKWGWQAVMQSNEGYPDKTDILTRRVNENIGAHRFGGGNDGECDPHVLDILAGKARGERSEVTAQHEALTYKCGSKVARLPMVYPGN
jgi:carbohydrate-binding DOMON domain-containing protein